MIASCFTCGQVCEPDPSRVAAAQVCPDCSGRSIGNWALALEGLQDQAKILDAQVEECKRRIRLALPGPGTKVNIEGWQFDWRRTNRDSFDSKRFSREHPNLVAKYTASKPVESLHVTRAKEAP